MKAYSEHECYEAGIVNHEFRRLVNHWLRCPACGHHTQAGDCYPAINAGSHKQEGSYCPNCSGPGVAPADRVLMDCVEHELTEGQKLLLAP